MPNISHMHEYYKQLDFNSLNIQVICNSGSPDQSYGQGVKVVVNISGGRDSQAALVHVLNNFDPANVHAMFCDTGFEHPDTYAHADRLLEILSSMGGSWSKIRALTPESREFVERQLDSVENQVLKHKRYPGAISRFCTKNLKLIPSLRAICSLARNAENIIYNVIGIHGAESSNRRTRYSKFSAHNLLRPNDIMDVYPKYMHERYKIYTWLPLLELNRKDIDRILEKAPNGLDVINPLYSKGFDRVGCFPCLTISDNAQEIYYSFDQHGESVRSKMLEINKIINYEFDLNYKGRLPTKYLNENSGCSFCEV